MSHYRVGCDAPKYFSLFAVLDDQGKLHEEQRVNHEPGAIREYLSGFPEGTPVALESVGNWYWIVDEIEAAGCVPRMAHALFAKKMMAHVHKTDKLDAEGLARLEHLGSLPTVWIAPGEIRDARELPRTRMAFSKIRTGLKNRMHSTLATPALAGMCQGVQPLPGGRRRHLRGQAAIPTLGTHRRPAPGDQPLHAPGA